MPAADRFSSHVPALISSAVATVIAAVAGSYLGTGGTLAGLAVGSLISGTAALWVERAVRRSAEFTRLKAAAIRRKGAPLNVEETQRIAAIVDRRHGHRFRWRRVALGCVFTLAAAGAAVTGWEVAAARPMAAIVHGDQGSGTTLTGGSVAPPRAQPTVAPAVTFTPTETPTTASVSPSPSASQMGVPLPVDSLTPTTVPASTTPAPTPTDPPVTPAPSPAASLRMAAPGHGWVERTRDKQARGLQNRFGPVPPAANARIAIQRAPGHHAGSPAVIARTGPLVVIHCPAPGR